jgi:hypothetical protein
MVQEPSRSDVAAAAQQVPGELLKLGEAQTEAMLAMQKELLAAYQQISRAWLERVKSESDLWSELASKMSGAGSVPDALDAYRECWCNGCKWRRMTDAGYSMTRKKS